MKSRMRSHSKSHWRLNSSIVAWSVAASGKQPHEPDRGRLDQVDAGRFQRLEEAGGKTERDAVAVPHLAPLAARETEPVGVRELLAVEVGEQQLLGRLVVDMLARIDEAVAGAVLERNAPLPSRLARRRPRIGSERIGARAGHRHRPVAGQPVAPVLVTGLQRLLDQQSAKARAVDEEIGRDPCGRLRASPTRCRHPHAVSTSTIRPRSA